MSGLNAGKWSLIFENVQLAEIHDKLIAKASHIYLEFILNLGVLS